MKRTMAKAALHTSMNVLFFTLIGTSLLALTYLQTKDSIAKSEQEEKLKLIAQLLPRSSFDNDIVSDTLKLSPDLLLGSTTPSLAYRARLAGQPVGVAMEVVAPDGYSGRIDLLVAIKADGMLAGVRVVSHKETPGLGDYIDIAKSTWIDIFDGKTLTTGKDDEWQVKKDGGQFDYMAGATISPRAVVKAVHKAMQYFALHRDELFAAAVLAQEKPEEKK
jgi:electron transport complex protein RnfG